MVSQPVQYDEMRDIEKIMIATPCGIPAERGFIIQMAIIKQSETFSKQLGSIGLTSGGKV